MVLGGRSDPEARYLDPTIVYPVSWDDRIMDDEVFGPILPVLTYRTLDEAFSRIAAAPQPLAAFIFSRNQSAIDRFVGELSFGGGAVNQVNIHLFVESMPFGGVGSAGMGHYYGKYGFDMLTHAKSMLISPPDVAIDHLFPPYTAEKRGAQDVVRILIARSSQVGCKRRRRPSIGMLEGRNFGELIVRVDKGSKL